LFPPPPRGDGEFREFYRDERPRTIGLVAALSGDRIRDPEQVAENAWSDFYPHWADCPAPGGYLRQCVVSAVRDEQRKMRRAPAETLAGVSEDDFTEAGFGPWLRDTPRRPGPAAGRDPFDPALAAALASLSDTDREVLVLAYELEPGQRTVVELAAILEVNRVAAHMRLSRAHARLGKLLGEGYPADRLERLQEALTLRERPAP
jgi:DNA-directed RNA polymerase specialized sigma24 family protein